MKICTKCGKTKSLINFHKNPTSSDGYRFDCTDCRSIARKDYHIKNKAKENKQSLQYGKESSAKKNHINSKYRASKLKAIPRWLTSFHLEQIESLYKLSKTVEKLTKVKHHVDHIIPLQGETVSGLHVPWNLRIITASENSSKKNKLLTFL
jgi:5-methylcytosine-specific restriction endonuclease McrA